VVINQPLLTLDKLNTLKVVKETIELSITNDHSGKARNEVEGRGGCIRHIYDHKVQSEVSAI
jgi:hypothetical protein